MKKIILGMLLIQSVSIFAQEKTDSSVVFLQEDFINLHELNNETIATFKTTRLANGHTVEQVKEGVLDMRINHRFGKVSDGGYNFFGLDNAVTRIGFDYGIRDYLMVGVGRSTLNKEYDAFIKLKILSQNDKNLPVTLNYLFGTYLVSERYNVDNLPFHNRLTYFHQILVARKVSEKLSLQLMPALVHFNMTNLTNEKNTIAVAGFGGRYKLNKRLALTAEYYYVPSASKRDNNFNPLTIGLDIETGGHVFQLFFSNATGVSERSLFTNSLSQWSKGELHFGFNISRVFTLKTVNKN